MQTHRWVEAGYESRCQVATENQMPGRGTRVEQWAHTAYKINFTTKKDEEGNIFKTESRLMVCGNKTYDSRQDRL